VGHPLRALYPLEVSLTAPHPYSLAAGQMVIANPANGLGAMRRPARTVRVGDHAPAPAGLGVDDVGVVVSHPGRSKALGEKDVGMSDRVVVLSPDDCATVLSVEPGGLKAVGIETDLACSTVPSLMFRRAP